MPPTLARPVVVAPRAPRKTTSRLVLGVLASLFAAALLLYGTNWVTEKAAQAAIAEKVNEQPNQMFVPFDQRPLDEQNKIRDDAEKERLAVEKAEQEKLALYEELSSTGKPVEAETIASTGNVIGITFVAPPPGVYKVEVGGKVVSEGRDISAQPREVVLRLQGRGVIRAMYLPGPSPNPVWTPLRAVYYIK